MFVATKDELREAIEQARKWAQSHEIYSKSSSAQMLPVAEYILNTKGLSMFKDQK